MMLEKSKAKKLSIIQQNRVIIEIGNLIYFVGRVVSIIEICSRAIQLLINNEKTVSETTQHRPINFNCFLNVINIS